MDLKEILTISGQSGLFKFISQTKNGIIVEGLENKKRMVAFANYKVVSLNDIAIFTDTDEVPLREVFKKIFEKENGAQVMSGKIDEKKIKAYFEELLPDYDRERVYVSDMKKVLTWYNILVKNGINSFEDEKKENENQIEEAIESDKDKNKAE